MKFPNKPEYCAEIIVTDNELNIVETYFEFSNQVKPFRFSAHSVFTPLSSKTVLFSNVFRDTSYEISATTLKPFVEIKKQNALTAEMVTNRYQFDEYRKNHSFFINQFLIYKSFYTFVQSDNNVRNTYFYNYDSHEVFFTLFNLAKELYIGPLLGITNDDLIFSLPAFLFIEHQDDWNRIIKKKSSNGTLSMLNRLEEGDNDVIIRISLTDSPFP